MCVRSCKSEARRSCKMPAGEYQVLQSNLLALWPQSAKGVGEAGESGVDSSWYNEPLETSADTVLNSSTQTLG